MAEYTQHFTIRYRSESNIYTRRSAEFEFFLQKAITLGYFSTCENILRRCTMSYRGYPGIYKCESIFPLMRSRLGSEAMGIQRFVEPLP